MPGTRRDHLVLNPRVYESVGDDIHETNKATVDPSSYPSETVRAAEFDPIPFGLGVDAMPERVGVQLIRLAAGKTCHATNSRPHSRRPTVRRSVGESGQYFLEAPRQKPAFASRRTSTVGFTRAELETYRNVAVPDLIGFGCVLLFVGINPGLWTAATQTHFCHPSNRFYPALRAAGIIDWEVDASVGMTKGQEDDLIAQAIGITNLVNRATARASELGKEELVSGAARLGSLVNEVEPRVVAVAGVTAYRVAFEQRNAKLGKQPGRLGSSELWVIPNPSGLNAHETIDSLAGWYAEAARSAGIK